MTLLEDLNIKGMSIPNIEGTFLSTEDVKAIHDYLINTSEVNDQNGFIDQEGRLFESAVNSIFTGFGGYQKYPTVEEKAARLCYALIENHSFLNANKRTAMFAMIMTLEINGKPADFDNDQLFNMINGIASKEKTYDDLLAFITAPSRKQTR